MAQLKVKQISDFISQVAAQPVGTATATAIAGVQADVDANAIAIALNTAKVTNVTTDLAVTESTTTNIVTSSDGTDATLTGATTLKAGLMTKAIFDEHVANNAKVGITTDQADAIVANTAKVGITAEQSSAIVANATAIDTEKGRINALLLNSTEALDTFAEIVKFIGELDTADIVGLSAALSTAVSNDAVHTADISTNASAIADLETSIGELDFVVDLSLLADGTSNTVVNSKGADAKLNGATEEDAGLMTAEDFRKLSTIQDGADVTDAVSVAAAGALMEINITNLAEVKAFASSDYASAAQGLLADSALQNAGAFDASGSAATAKTEAIAAAKTYTDTTVGTEETARIAADDALDARIDALAGVNSDEVVARWVSKTSFSVETAFDLTGHVAVFVNGLQVHELSGVGEEAEGWASANGLAFTVQNLGYDLEATDHIIISGTLA